MHRDFAAGKIKKDEKHLAVFWLPSLLDKLSEVSPEKILHYI